MKLSQPIIFYYSFTCVEESNYMNDYMKAKRETRGNKNGNKTSEWEQYTQYTRLKKNAYYKIFNIFLRRNQVHLDWKDILLVVEVSP